MSGGLKGQFNHSIDAKGRMIVPNKLRDKLGESFVITKGAGWMSVRISGGRVGDI